MLVFRINPSDVAFGLGVITPRWSYVLAGARPDKYGDRIVAEEPLERFDGGRVSGDAFVPAPARMLAATGEMAFFERAEHVLSTGQLGI